MRTGMEALLAAAEEAGYGAFQAPNRFFPFVSESMVTPRERIESAGIRKGQRLIRSDQWQEGRRSPGGDVTVELSHRNMGIWLEHMFGAVATAQPDAVNSPSVFEHTFTPGELDGKSLTVQVGQPSLDGVVQPFSFLGCKIPSWELAVSASNEIARVRTSLVAKDEDLAQALAVPAYPTGKQYRGIDAALTVAAVETKVRSLTLSGTTPLLDQRFDLGTAVRDEPFEGGGLREITGQLDANFEDLDDYNRFKNGTEAELILTFTGPVIEDAFTFLNRWTLNIRYDGETPQVGGRDEVRQPIPIKVIDPGAGGASVLYRTDDATP